MNRKLLVTIAAALLSSLSISQAGAAGGLYLGGGIGQSGIKDNVSTENFDTDDAAWKAFVGYRFKFIPIIDLAVEGGYTDFGKPSQSVSGQNVRFKLNGYNAAGLLIFPLGPVDLYGKAGVISWDSDIRTAGATTTGRSGSDLFYGAGIGFNFGKLGIRAEYERYEIKDVDRVDMFSVSLLFHF
jgi:outer membrane immunogenic protein